MTTEVSTNRYTLEQLLEVKNSYKPNKIEFTSTQRSNLKAVQYTSQISQNPMALDKKSNAFHSSEQMEQRGEGDKNTEAGNFKEARKTFNTAVKKNVAEVAEKMNELTGPENSVKLILEAVINNQNEDPEKYADQYIIWMEVCAAFYRINSNIKDSIVKGTMERIEELLPSPVEGKPTALNESTLRYLRSAACWLSCLLRIKFLTPTEFCKSIVKIRDQITLQCQAKFLTSALTIAGPYLDCRSKPILETSFLFSYLNYIISNESLQLKPQHRFPAMDLFDLREKGWGIEYFEIKNQFGMYQEDETKYQVPATLLKKPESTLKGILCVAKNFTENKNEFIDFAELVLSTAFQQNLGYFMDTYIKNQYDVNEYIIDITDTNILSSYFEIIYTVIAKFISKYSSDISFESYIKEMFNLYPYRLHIQKAIFPTPPKFLEIITNPEIFEQDDNSYISIELCNTIFQKFRNNTTEYNEFVFGQKTEPITDDDDGEERLESFWEFLRKLYYNVKYPSEAVDAYLNEKKSSKGNWPINDRMLGLYKLFSDFVNKYKDDEEVDIGQKYTEEINKEELTFYLGNMDNALQESLTKASLAILHELEEISDENMNIIAEITIRDLLGKS